MSTTIYPQRLGVYPVRVPCPICEEPVQVNVRPGLPGSRYEPPEPPEIIRVTRVCRCVNLPSVDTDEWYDTIERAALGERAPTYDDYLED